MTHEPKLIPIFLDYKESFSLQNKQNTLLTSSMIILYSRMALSCPYWRLIFKSHGGVFFILRGQAEVPVHRVTVWVKDGFHQSLPQCLSVSHPSGLSTDSPSEKPNSSENSSIVYFYCMHIYEKIFLQTGDKIQGSYQFHLYYPYCAKICSKGNFFFFF